MSTSNNTDPQFIEKVRDIVGLYLAPPVGAMVLAVDEKNQMQAPDRTAPVLPMMPAAPARQTHDYVWHGTTSLFAALDLATGAVIGRIQRRHRHQEFLRFLRTIDRSTLSDVDLHLIHDNYGTHKTPPRSISGCSSIRGSIYTSRRRIRPGLASWKRWFAKLTTGTYIAASPYGGGKRSGDRWTCCNQRVEVDVSQSHGPADAGRPPR